MMTSPPLLLTPDEDGVINIPPLGLVQQTNDEYHSGQGISKSHLDAIHGSSPLHYWHRYINPAREHRQPTEEMVMGSAIHTAILEPDLLSSEVVLAPPINRRTKEGKAEWAAFQKANSTKLILDDDDYQVCLAVRDAVWRHPIAPGLLTGGQAEQSFYAIDPETGELIKCRTDYMHDNGSMIVDLKTTKDASPAGFGKSAANFRYPVQTAWYHRVLDAAFGEHPQDWVFLAVEKEPPYAIGIYIIEADQVERAAIAADRDLMRIVECRRSNQWPDYGMDPQPLLLPAWSRL